MALSCKELNAWCEQLGPDAWDDAREEFRKQNGRDGSMKEVFVFMVATKGTARIKAIWEWINTASGDEIARRGTEPADLPLA
jgi:hypothetical protein